MLLAHLGLALVFLGATVPAFSSEKKPEKRKSQAAYQRGQRADQAGRREEAIGDYSEALEDDPGNAAALRARGLDYLASGDRDRAHADLEQAVSLQPGDAQGYWARGDYFAKAGDSARAIQDYTTAIGMKPGTYGSVRRYKVDHLFRIPVPHRPALDIDDSAEITIENAAAPRINGGES